MAHEDRERADEVAQLEAETIADALAIMYGPVVTIEPWALRAALERRVDRGYRKNRAGDRLVVTATLRST